MYIPLILNNGKFNRHAIKLNVNGFHFDMKHDLKETIGLWSFL